MAGAVRERHRWATVLAAVGFLFSSCGPTATASDAPKYRVTGVVRASCYGGRPGEGQKGCSLHAQIQNEGGPGTGGSAELTILYMPLDSDLVRRETCSTDFPALATKDVAELDCGVTADPPIYAPRIVGTDIKIQSK